MTFSEEPLILTFDVGTQSVRALLINPHGIIEASAGIVYESPVLPSEVDGRAEQYPDFYYDRICECTRKLKQNSDTDIFRRVKAVTLACIRDSVLILDKNYKPLRNTIIWMDRRRASSSPEPGFLIKLLFASVGMTETINMLYKDSFCNWIKDYEPELWNKTEKFVFLSTYINFRLTGTLKDSVANQVGHVPFDNRKRRWMKKGLARCVADIPLRMLTEIVETGEIIGRINAETSEKSGIPVNLPLLACGTDKACEALGLSVISEDKAAISLGTASTIQFCTQHYFEPEPFLPAYPSVIPGKYNAENQIYRGFWTITNFIREFCSMEKTMAENERISTEQILDKYLKDVPPGCNGLLFTPHLAPGAGNPFAKGIMIGLNDRHTKKHIYRAIIEGICFELMHAMIRMERRSGQKIKELFVAGGGSKCNTILQIIADMFGLPAKRIQTHESTAIGAALTGFVGLGIFKSFNDGVMEMVKVRDTFMPDENIHKFYRKLYNEVYSKLEKNNTALFRKIGKITEGKI